MNSPLISVCCLSYNHSKYVEVACESIFAQTYRNVEIIVIDDGSLDNTYQLLLQLRDRSPFPMQVISQANTGKPAASINRLLRMATGQFVRLLSTDDCLLPESTEEMVGIIASDANVQFVTGDQVSVIDQNGNLTGEIIKFPFFGNRANDVTVLDMVEWEYSKGGTFFIQNALFRKATLDAAGGCDEDLIGDDIVFRLRLFGYMSTSGMSVFSIINRSTFLYRVHSSNLHKNAARQVETIRQVCARFFPHRPWPPFLRDWTCEAVRQKFDEIRTLLDHDKVHHGSEKSKRELETRIEELLAWIRHQHLGIRETRYSKAIKFLRKRLGLSNSRIKPMLESIRFVLRRMHLLELTYYLLGHNPDGSVKEEAAPSTDCDNPNPNK